MAPKTKAPTKKKSGRLNLKKVEKERSQQPRQTCQEKHKAAQKETKRKEKEATEAKAKELEQKARADAASNVEKAVDWIWKQVQNEVTAGLVEFDEMLDPNVLNFYYALGITKFNIVRTTLVSAFEKSHKPGHKRSVGVRPYLFSQYEEVQLSAWLLHRQRRKVTSTWQELQSQRADPP